MTLIPQEIPLRKREAIGLRGCLTVYNLLEERNFSMQTYMEIWVDSKI